MGQERETATLAARLAAMAVKLDDYSDWDDSRWGEEIDEAAELIREAVNAHEALVEALKDLIEYTAKADAGLALARESGPIVRARAALTLARGVPEDPRDE